MTINMRGDSFRVTVYSKTGRPYTKSFSPKRLGGYDAAKLKAEEWELQAQLDLKQGRTPARQAPGEPVTRPDAKNLAMLQPLFQHVYRRRWSGTPSEETYDVNGRGIITVLGSTFPIQALNLPVINQLIGKWKADGNKDSTINRKLQLVNVLLDEAIILGLIPRDAKPKIPALKEAEGRLRVITRAEELSLLAKLKDLDSRAHNLVLFLMDTGARAGEALAVRWEQINLDQGMVTLRNTKGRQPRSVPLTDRLVALLRQLKVDGLPLGPFHALSDAGSTVRSAYHRVRAFWNIAKAEIGLRRDQEFTLHACRHTCASRLVQNGVDIVTVQRWLGHSSLDMTMRYAHMSPDALSRARDVLNRLERAL